MNTPIFPPLYQEKKEEKFEQISIYLEVEEYENMDFIKEEKEQVGVIIIDIL